MGSLLLIRHGQAAYGTADHDRLTPRGVEQAIQVGKFLTGKVDRIYVGPHRRHQQTYDHAREVGGLPAPTPLAEFAEYPAVELLTHLMPKLIAEDARFAELPKTPTRELAGKALHTILGKWARDEWQVEGVERVDKFAERVRAGLDRVIAEAQSGARIAVFTSAGPIGVSVGLTFGATAHHMIRSSIVVRNTSVTEIRFRSEDFSWHPERIALVSFNSTHHLPPELNTEY
jgi:broad specificity phosphatase PhoE